MTFDNTPIATKIQIYRSLCVIFAAILVALNYTTTMWSYIYEITGIPRGAFTILVMLLLVGYAIYHFIRRSQFIYFNDDDSKIIIRYYTLSFFDSKKNSYEIPKSQFIDAKVKYSFFKLREEVVIRQRVGANLAQYPPFSISALPADKKIKLLKALESYSK